MTYDSVRSRGYTSTHYPNQPSIPTTSFFPLNLPAYSTSTLLYISLTRPSFPLCPPSKHSTTCPCVFFLIFPFHPELEKHRHGPPANSLLIPTHSPTILGSATTASPGTPKQTLTLITPSCTSGRRRAPSARLRTSIPSVLTTPISLPPPPPDRSKQDHWQSVLHAQSHTL